MLICKKIEQLNYHYGEEDFGSEAGRLLGWDCCIFSYYYPVPQ
jgi:hypothetical protein